jgi:predicted dehydrogenase
LLAPTGKPILKEKPAARSLKEAEEVYAACPRLRTLTDRQYFATAPLVKRLIRTIGPIRHLLAYSSLVSPNYRHTWRNDPARAGGGALIDIGYHLIDMTVRMIGRPTSVNAVERTARRPGYLVEEDVEITIGNGETSATLRANRVGRRRSEFFRVTGERGSIRWSSREIRLKTDSTVTRAWHVDESTSARVRRMLTEEVSLVGRGQTDREHALLVQAVIDELYRSLPSRNLIHTRGFRPSPAFAGTT